MSEHHTVPERVRPPIKVAHLVLGSFFLGIAALWALTESGTLTWQGTSYLVPLTLLIAGAIGLAASLVGSAADRRRAASGEAAAPATTSQDAAPADAADTTVLPPGRPEPPENTENTESTETTEEP